MRFTLTSADIQTSEVSLIYLDCVVEPNCSLDKVLHVDFDLFDTKSYLALFRMYTILIYYTRMVAAKIQFHYILHVLLHMQLLLFQRGPMRILTHVILI